mgnify:CR=1 FL=1
MSTGANSYWYVASCCPNHFPYNIKPEHEILLLCVFGMFLLVPHVTLTSQCDTFFNLKSVFNNLFHGHDLNHTRLYLNIGECIELVSWLEKQVCNQMVLVKLFPSWLMDVIAPYFHIIEKHQCHQSVEQVFLEDTTLDFSMIACVLK